MDGFLSLLDYEKNNKNEVWWLHNLKIAFGAHVICVHPHQLTSLTFSSWAFPSLMLLFHSYTFSAQACPTGGLSRGLLPLSGMFVTQKPLWLTTLPLINLCSNVTFQGSLLWLPYLELQPAPPSLGTWDLPHTLFCFAFFHSTCHFHTFHVTFTFMLISWVSRSLYRNLEWARGSLPLSRKVRRYHHLLILLRKCQPRRKEDASGSGLQSSKGVDFLDFQSKHFWL